LPTNFIIKRIDLSVKIAEKQTSGVWQKVEDFKLLVKLRLNLLVVFTSGIGYVIASGSSFSWFNLLILCLGGFLITGAANSLNQVLEKDYDKLMPRTENRPLPTGRMSVSTAVLYAGFMSLAGIFMLAMFNPLTALIGTVSLIIYSFVYTPVKRISSIAVLIGAIPGALPPMIGWVAATGSIESGAIILFAIQFIWQFPHFWAISWLQHDDYKNAGYHLLPSKEGRDKSTATQVLIYALFLLPITLFTWWIGVAGIVVTVVNLLAALYYIYYAWKLYEQCSMDAAKRLMFSSFFYLPVVMIALLLGAIL
jgi:protoheme IX farnesyltransferase